MFPKRSTLSTVAEICERPSSGSGTPTRELRGIEGRPKLHELDARGEMRGGGREDIAGVERVRDVRQAVALGRQLVRRIDAELVGDERQQPVVGADEHAAVVRPQCDRAAVAAHSRIDHREVHAGRHVRGRVPENERALQHRLGRDPVRDVDHPRVRGDAGDHAVAGPDEIVLEPEIGHEGDDAHG
jgi:hypothetical protein